MYRQEKQVIPRLKSSALVLLVSQNSKLTKAGQKRLFLLVAYLD